jgi:hypothetical protein
MKNPPSESRVVSCVQLDRQTDLTKQIVAIRNLAKAPKKALAPAAIRTLDRPVHSPIALPTTISRLL